MCLYTLKSFCLQKRTKLHTSQFKFKMKSNQSCIKTKPFRSGITLSPSISITIKMSFLSTFTGLGALMLIQHLWVKMTCFNLVTRKLFPNCQKYKRMRALIKSSRTVIQTSPNKTPSLQQRSLTNKGLTVFQISSSLTLRQSQRTKNIRFKIS